MDNQEMYPHPSKILSFSDFLRQKFEEIINKENESAKGMREEMEKKDQEILELKNQMKELRKYKDNIKEYKDKLNKDVQQEFENRYRENIKELIENHDKMSQELLSVRDKNKTLKKNTQLLESKIKDIQELKNENSELQIRCFYQQSSYSQSKGDQSQQIQSTPYNHGVPSPKIQKFQFRWDQASYNHNRLKVEGLRVQRINEILKKTTVSNSSLINPAACISSEECFPASGKHKVIFHIASNKGKYAVTFGIITEKHKNQQFDGKKQGAILYHSHWSTKGSLDIAENEILTFDGNNLGTQTGGSIEMVVDFDNFLITFTKRQMSNLQEKETIAQIPESFAGKKIYVYVRMRNLKDSIDIVEK